MRRFVGRSSSLPVVGRLAWLTKLVAPPQSNRWHYQHFCFQQQPPLQCSKRCVHSRSTRSPPTSNEPTPVDDCLIKTEYLKSILSRNTTSGMSYRQVLFNVKLQKADYPRVLELARRFGINENDPHHRCRACGKTVDAHSRKERDLTIPVHLRVKHLVEDVFGSAANMPCSEVTEDTGLPPTGKPPQPDGKGFLLPGEDLQIIKDAALRTEDQHLFVRAPIGSGKSTIVATLRRDPRVIRVSFTIGTPPCEELCSILGLSETTYRPHIIHPLLDGKMLVLDECHLAFHDDALLDCLLKAESQSAFFVLMFSSTAAHAAAQGTNVIVLPTPVAVSKKTYLDLRFTSDDVVKIVIASGIARKILAACGRQDPTDEERAEVRDHIAKAMELLFEGHRLLTVYALDKLIGTEFHVPTYPFAADAWIQVFHRKLDDLLLSNRSQMKDCRSAIINNQFKQLYHGQIVCGRVLCEGSVDTTEPFNDRSIGTLLTRGALRPLEHDRDSVYIWSNAFIARFFFKCSYNSLRPRLLQRDGVSLILLGLSWFDPAHVFGKRKLRSDRSRLFFLQMPFEEEFIAALRSGWSFFEDEFSVQEEVAFRNGSWLEVGNNERVQEGRVDLMLSDPVQNRRTFVEVLVVGYPLQKNCLSDTQQKAVDQNNETISNHIEPFFTGTKNGKHGRLSYQEAMKNDVVVVIFSHPDAFRSAQEQAASQLRKYAAQTQHAATAKKMKILVLSVKSYFRYCVHLVSVDDNSSVVSRDIREELMSTLCGMRISSCGGHLEVNQRQPTVLEYCNDRGIVSALQEGETDPVIDVVTNGLRIEDIATSFDYMCSKEWREPNRQSSVWVRVGTSNVTKNQSEVAERMSFKGNLVRHLERAIREVRGTHKRFNIYHPSNQQVPLEGHEKLQSTSDESPYVLREDG